MFTALLQVTDFLLAGRIHFFLLFFIYVWVVWGVKFVFSRRYRKVEEEYETSVSVVIPVFKEDPNLFNTVLASISQNHPHELIVVLDGADGDIERIARRWTEKVFPLSKRGKRPTIATGVREATGEIIAIVDSDSWWEPETLQNLVKPFADPKVGGVTTRQHIFDPDRNTVRRFADWMEDLRFSLSTPAQSSFGTVGCLSGRTVAYRREVLVKILPELLGETFLGVPCTIGDDRVLTNLTLANGWKTVYQSDARVYTDCPNTLGAWARQQLRWARSSQRETLKSLPWLIKKPFLAFCFVTDITTPFFLIAVLANAGWRLVSGETNMLVFSTIFAGSPLTRFEVQLLGAFFGAMVSIGVRQLGHFRRKPRDIRMLPVFVVLLTMVLTPIRILGFMTMAEQDWLTRILTKGETGEKTVATPKTSPRFGRGALARLLPGLRIFD